MTLATDGLILSNEIENAPLECSLKPRYSSSHLSIAVTQASVAVLLITLLESVVQ